MFLSNLNDFIFYKYEYFINTNLRTVTSMFQMQIKLKT